METTIYDLDSMTEPPPKPPVRSEHGRLRWLIAGVCLVAGLVLLWVYVWRSARPEPGMLQQAYFIPSPEPLSLPQVPPPAVIITAPPAPQVVQIPPPRPSLWEIRAELKRGLGEWEYPHYVNAPHYGSGPDSSPPAQIKPHIAAAPAW